jgi:hypothetical protein
VPGASGQHMEHHGVPVISAAVLAVGISYIESWKGDLVCLLAGTRIQDFLDVGE